MWLRFCIQTPNKYTDTQLSLEVNIFWRVHVRRRRSTLKSTGSLIGPSLWRHKEEKCFNKITPRVNKG